MRSLLAHSRPGASVDEWLDLALECLVHALEKQKFGKCSRPEKQRGSKNPRYFPLEAKREAREQAKVAAAAAALRADEIIPWLRVLGYSAQQARHGVELCAHILDAPIEVRMKPALRGLAPRCVRSSPHAPSAPA